MLKVKFTAILAAVVVVLVAAVSWIYFIQPSNAASLTNGQYNGQPLVAEGDQFSSITENERTANRYDYWIAYIDPFVTEKSDGTFKLDAKGLEKALRHDHPELFFIISGSDSTKTEDIETISILCKGIEIINKYLQQGKDGEKARWYRYYWWGTSVCFSGNDADNAIRYLTYGTLFGMLPWPWCIIGGNFVYLASTAQYYTSTSSCHGFCLTTTYAGLAVWVSRAC